MGYQGISAKIKIPGLKIQQIIFTNKQKLIYRLFGESLNGIIRRVTDMNKKIHFAIISKMR
jgi:hypothetical protein